MKLADGILAPWLLLGTVGLLSSCQNGTSRDLQQAGAAGRSPSETAPLCDPTVEDCDHPCARADDCESGYACVASDLSSPPTELRPDVRENNVARGGLAGNGTRSMAAFVGAEATDEDAGQDLMDTVDLLDTDAGVMLQSSLRLPAYFCSLTCSTELCAKPGGVASMVCASPQGSCRRGCDETLRSCSCEQVEGPCTEGTPLYCDVPKRRCVPLNPSCSGDSDCPIYDARLVAKGPDGLVRGELRCNQGRCRYAAGDPKSKLPLRAPLLDARAAPLQVHSPSAGQRIVDSQLNSFSFQFDVPAQVTVVSIVTREIKSLDDASQAAIWAAYVDAEHALAGVKLSDGGAMHAGVWSPSLPDIPADTRLFLFVLGYNHGKLVAQSDLIPFSYGARLAAPGDPCAQPSGELCAGTSLICVKGTCRAPCASDDDCSVGACDLPGRHSIAARLCSS